MARAGRGFDLAQQRRGAGADDVGQIVLGRGFLEEPVIGRLALQVVIEPRALTADMVQHHVRHQVEILADPADIAPVAQRGIDLVIVRDREAVIRGIGKEGQDMHAVDRAAQIPFEEIVQQVQRLVAAIRDRVAIGDDHGVRFGPQVVRRAARTLASGMPLGPESGDHVTGERAGIVIGIDLREQGVHARAQAGGGGFGNGVSPGPERLGASVTS